MPAPLVITEDALVWFGAGDKAPFGEVCLVRRRTGELLLATAVDLTRLDDVWMWAVVPPPPQFILQKETT